MKVGIGFDVHKLVTGQDLFLGGVKFHHEKGLLGHSDADVLIHAIIDAMLGAAALGDIGRSFPDTDDRYKNISSITLLEKTNELIKEKNLLVNNIDATVICEKPRLKDYIDTMEENIANALQVSKDIINIKATTTETLGFTGRGDGIASQAICSLKEK